MSHILAKLRGVPIQTITARLREDAPDHATQGLFLEHVWQNNDDQDEILFLFRTDDLSKAKEFIEKTHAEAKKENPEINLPTMMFLEGE